MPKVICTHRHASGLINGIPFEPHPLGRISEEMSQEQVNGFLSIPGYVSEDCESTANIASQEAQNENAGKFMASSFADMRAEMPTSLQDSSPGWQKADEETNVKDQEDSPATKADDAAKAETKQTAPVKSVGKK